MEEKGCKKGMDKGRVKESDKGRENRRILHVLWQHVLKC